MGMSKSTTIHPTLNTNNATKRREMSRSLRRNGRHARRHSGHSIGSRTFSPASLEMHISKSLCSHERTASDTRTSASSNDTHPSEVMSLTRSFTSSTNLFASSTNSLISQLFNDILNIGILLVNESFRKDTIFINISQVLHSNHIHAKNFTHPILVLCLCCKFQCCSEIVLFLFNATQ